MIWKVRANFPFHEPRVAVAGTQTMAYLVTSRKEGCPEKRYSPTLLRELLLSESEGMMDKTLYVEPGDKKGDHLLLTTKGSLLYTTNYHQTN